MNVLRLWILPEVGALSLWTTVQYSWISWLCWYERSILLWDEHIMAVASYLLVRILSLIMTITRMPRWYNERHSIFQGNIYANGLVRFAYFSYVLNAFKKSKICSVNADIPQGWNCFSDTQSDTLAVTGCMNALDTAILNVCEHIGVSCQYSS